MADNTAVSIIIPTYNRSGIVSKAIESALKQKNENDEIFVVDDCSTDNTQSVVAQYGDRIKYIRLSVNSGLSAARNAGIRESSNPLLAFLDDDDEWNPHNLTLRKQLMGAHPELVYTFSNFSVRLHDGRIKHNQLFSWGQKEQNWDKIIAPGVLFSSLAPLPEKHEDFKVHIGEIYRSQMNDDHVLPSTMVVRREAAGDALYFSEHMRFLESWAYSSKLAKKGPVAYLDLDTTWQNQYNVPRLTDASMLLRYTTQIYILENQWGRDSEFLREHGAVYQERLDQERIKRVKEYIATGRTRKARDDIKKIISGTPPFYIFLSMLPEMAMRPLMLLRNSIKKKIRSNNR